MYTKEIADVNMSLIYKGEFSEGVFASIAYYENEYIDYCMAHLDDKCECICSELHLDR